MSTGRGIPGFVTLVLVLVLVLVLTLGLFTPRFVFSSGKGPTWLADDSIAALNFIQAITFRPEAIDSTLLGSLSTDHDLGFGFQLREAWVNPAGKLGFALKVVYAPDSAIAKVKGRPGKRAISFEVKPVCNYSSLKDQYEKILGSTFRVRSNHKGALIFLPYYWNQSAVSVPLATNSIGGKSDDSLLSESLRRALAFYMTPYSGTLYGIRGGEVNQLLENRDGFLNIAEILQADRRLCRYLLRSINPASRLTAIEFIIRHREKFPDFEILEKKIFPALFENPKMIATMRGRHKDYVESRKLVLECASQQVTQDTRGVLRMF